MPLGGLHICKRAANFHLSNWKSLLPISPFLCFPVVGDALSSLVIQQKVHGSGILPWQALGSAWMLVPRLLAMKIYLEAVGILWALVPIYGILPGTKHRLYWAMASNVLVFEGLSGEIGRDRCRDLIENFSGGLGVRTLITIPSVLIATFVVVWVVLGNIVEVFSYGFWTLLFLFLWITFPGSGAVNTFLYLEILDREKTEA